VVRGRRLQGVITADRAQIGQESATVREQHSSSISIFEIVGWSSVALAGARDGTEEEVWTGEPQLRQK
jgi:hypothetical protein